VSVQLLDKWVNKPFRGYLIELFEECICTNSSRPSKAEVAQRVARAWAQVTTANIVNSWKSIGHTAAADDKDKDNIVANQLGA
jgi:hypothetical protein